MKANIITLVIASILFSTISADAQNSNQKAEGYRGIWFTLGQVNTQYGDKYSGGLGTYTVKHIPLAIYSPEVDKTFFVYGGTPSADQTYLVCMAGCYDHKTGMLQRPVTVHDKGQIGVIDPHDNPTIQIDKDGYVWVFVAGRGNTRPGIRYRSTKPYDISSFEYINESIMAYPQVHYDNEKGFFVFFTRYDGKRRIFFMTSKDGVTWTDYQPVASIMEPGETLSGHYQLTNYNGKKLVCTFNRHPNGKVDQRTNIYYIESEDWGKTWTNAAGEKVELPVTREEGPALVKNFRKDGRNCYIKDINFDKDGNPVILYLTSDNHLTGPEGGIREWSVAHWNGQKWNHTHITRSTHCYDSGSLYIEGDTWTVIAPTEAGPQYWGTGGEMAVWQTENKGVIWERFKDLTRDSDRNHSYARRPVNAHPDFYAFWADGDPDKLSISELYFCNKNGEVFKMPYTMSDEWEKPIPYTTKTAFDKETVIKSCHPRLLLDKKGAKALKKKLESKGCSYESLKAFDSIIQEKAASVLSEDKDIVNPADKNTNMHHLLPLAYCYRIHNNQAALPKLKKDLMAICRGNWGTGFLGMSETALAVSVAYDWIWDRLTAEERDTVCNALIEKYLKKSDYNHFKGFKGNWSSICNCSIVMASLAVCEHAPELAEEYINSSYWNNKGNIKIVYEGGGYPEGFSYWNYGTQYQICMIESLKGIFGHDGGLSQTPGFMESALFALYTHGTNGATFSFADGGSTKDHPLLASWWFAVQQKNPTLAYAEKRFLNKGGYASSYQRLLPVMTVLFKDYDLDTYGFNPPTEQMWSCQGEIPLCVVRKGWNYNKKDIYLGVKGGGCNSWKTMVTSHSHMDAGSFVFEADGVRWADDIMRPSYGPWFKALKDAGSHSGATYQNSLRWNTFNVSNLAHNCIVSYCNDGSVEGKNHPTDYNVDGSATVRPVDEEGRQGAVVDMSAPMKGQVRSATRTIVVLKDGTLEVTDVIEALPDMDCPVEWRMLTETTAEISGKGIRLSRKSAGRTLSVKSSDDTVSPVCSVLPAVLPESWDDEFTYIQKLKGRSIASWSATVPAGKTVTFVTTLKK